MINRRDFLAISASCAAPWRLAGGADVHAQKVLGQEFLPDRIRIASLDLFERGGGWFARARSADGAEGWAVGHPAKMPLCHPVFTKVIAPFFKGRDARDLEKLVDEVFLKGSNYKMQGQLFWVPLALSEFAIHGHLRRLLFEPRTAPGIQGAEQIVPLEEHRDAYRSQSRRDDGTRRRRYRR